METGLRKRKQDVTVILSNIFFLGMGIDSAVFILFSVIVSDDTWRLVLLAIGLPQLAFVIAVCYIVLAKISVLESGDDEKSAE